MKSHEALNLAISGKTVEFARKLGLSVSLVNKWQEPTGDYSDSGAYNPLDRIETVVETAVLHNERELALTPVRWLAHRFGCVLVPVPAVASTPADVSARLLTVIAEFGHLAEETARNLSDGSLDEREFVHIQREAHHLMTAIVEFLHAAEASIPAPPYSPGRFRSATGRASF